MVSPTPPEVLLMVAKLEPLKGDEPGLWAALAGAFEEVYARPLDRADDHDIMLCQLTVRLLLSDAGYAQTRAASQL